MRWTKSTLRDSFFGLFTPVVDEVAVRKAKLEEIRHAMLVEVAELESQNWESGPDQTIMLGNKVRAASDIQTLWYARSELMQLLSRRWGEGPARERMETVTVRFVGLVSPGALRRPRAR